jgi:hypothetical protein
MENATNIYWHSSVPHSSSKENMYCNEGCHSRTHSLTHLLAYSFAHSLSRRITDSLNHLLTQSFAHSLTNSSTCLLFAHSLSRRITDSLNHLLTQSSFATHALAELLGFNYEPTRSLITRFAQIHLWLWNLYLNRVAHSLNHSLNHSLAHLLLDLFLSEVTRLTYASTHSVLTLFTCSLSDSLAHTFTLLGLTYYAPTHSLLTPFTCSAPAY